MGAGLCAQQYDMDTVTRIRSARGTTQQIMQAKVSSPMSPAGDPLSSTSSHWKDCWIRPFTLLETESRVALLMLLSRAGRGWSMVEGGGWDNECVWRRPHQHASNYAKYLAGKSGQSNTTQFLTSKLAMPCPPCSNFPISLFSVFLSAPKYRKSNQMKSNPERRVNECAL